MLSQSARPYIDASVPVLREHGPAITRRFYSDLFEAHPALRNLFNQGNQASGAQQGALASALFAYAANIDRPDALAPVIERIAHKHVSLGIQPAQYWTVGRYLLGAIQTVLGEAATPALLQAWDEAYWLLASTLIATEAKLYAGSALGAGELRSLRISEVRRESDEVVSYCLQTPDGQSPGTFAPGQYVSVAVDVPTLGLRQLRQYSLSDSPERPYWRITVKAEPAHAAGPAGTVSNQLQTTLQAGSTLLVGAPFGDFTPAITRDRPLVLLSAGVGVTPMLSVLHALADAGSTAKILFVQAARDPDRLLFATELTQLTTRLPSLTRLTFCDALPAPSPDLHQGPMHLAPAQLAPYAEADFCLCGPENFMRAQWRNLIAAGISPSRIQREIFGPDLLQHLLS